VQDLALKLPKVGEIVRKSASAVSFRTLAMLVDANVRLSSALEITAKATWHYHYKNFFIKLGEHIALGRTMHEGFVIEGHWLGPDSRSICGLIELASETGTGTEMLNEIADDYEEELDGLAGQIDEAHGTPDHHVPRPRRRLPHLRHLRPHLQPRRHHLAEEVRSWRSDPPLIDLPTISHKRDGRLKGICIETGVLKSALLNER